MVCQWYQKAGQVHFFISTSFKIVVNFFCNIFPGFWCFLQSTFLSLPWEIAHAYLQNPRKMLQKSLFISKSLVKGVFALLIKNKFIIVHSFNNYFNNWTKIGTRSGTRIVINDSLTFWILSFLVLSHVKVIREPRIGWH